MMTSENSAEVMGTLLSARVQEVLLCQHESVDVSESSVNVSTSLQRQSCVSKFMLTILAP